MDLGIAGRHHPPSDPFVGLETDQDRYPPSPLDRDLSCPVVLRAFEESGIQYDLILTITRFLHSESYKIDSYIPFNIFRTYLPYARL